jgi:hypothetical protein
VKQKNVVVAVVTIVVEFGRLFFPRLFSSVSNATCFAPALHNPPTPCVCIFLLYGRRVSARACWSLMMAAKNHLFPFFFFFSVICVAFFSIWLISFSCLKKKKTGNLEKNRIGKKYLLSTSVYWFVLLMFLLPVPRSRPKWWRIHWELGKCHNMYPLSTSSARSINSTKHRRRRRKTK